MMEKGLNKNIKLVETDKKKHKTKKKAKKE